MSHGSAGLLRAGLLVEFSSTLGNLLLAEGLLEMRRLVRAQNRGAGVGTVRSLGLRFEARLDKRRVVVGIVGCGQGQWCRREGRRRTYWSPGAAWQGADGERSAAARIGG